MHSSSSFLFSLWLLIGLCFPCWAWAEAIPVVFAVEKAPSHKKKQHPFLTKKYKRLSFYPSKQPSSPQKNQDLGPILPFFLIVLGVWLLLMGGLIGLGLYLGLAWLWITAIVLAALPTLLLALIFYIEFFTH